METEDQVEVVEAAVVVVPGNLKSQLDLEVVLIAPPFFCAMIVLSLPNYSAEQMIVVKSAKGYCEVG